MFINLSNHDNTQWSEAQLTAAAAYGEIQYMPFPNIPPRIDDAGLDAIVEEYYEKITAMDRPTVLVQGEMTFTYRLVYRLKQAGILCLAACSERTTKEYVDWNGATHKTTQFIFCGFRAY